MPPRRSTARAASSTPVGVPDPSPAKRSSRAIGSLPAEDASSRRVTRGASLQPSEASVSNVNNPNLPELQLGRSYAYGAKKSTALPAQLMPLKGMNLREMADRIDAEVQQADQNLAREPSQSDSPRDERARRRATRDSSRESSVDLGDVEKNKTKRTAAWADSLESSQLGEIPEEDSEVGQETPVNARQQETPSSFPSGIFDHSYNYERGLRRPNITRRKKEDSAFQKSRRATQTLLAKAGQRVGNASSELVDWLKHSFQALQTAMSRATRSSFVATVGSILFAIFIAVMTTILFCTMYTTSMCDPFTNSPLGQLLQRHCGRCTRPAIPPQTSLNFTSSGGSVDVDKLLSAISILDTRLHQLESNVGSRLENFDAALHADVDALRRHQLELATHIARLNRPKSGTNTGDVASPVIGKVNYFSPSNGALVNPHHTSPTHQKPLPFMARFALRAVGMARYTSQPPVTALQAWQDVGDCWCASASAHPTDQDSMRLGVDVAEWIYPTEIVLENYPSGGSLYPGSTPKVVELWADFSHLDSRQWEVLGIRDLQGPRPVGTGYGMIGRVEYDASMEASHVQEFALDVNRNGNVHYAKNFVVRVVSTYGSDYSCLYRVRLHGVSVYAGGVET